MTMVPVSIICCDTTPDMLSRIVTVEMSRSQIDELVVETIDQNVAAGEEREMHNAAHHAEHGPVTYLQHVKEGGFSVFVGRKEALQETFFGPDSWVAFMDDQGPGHASKVGPDGVKRTLRVLKGHLSLDA